MRYLNNAATTFPKPPGILSAVWETLNTVPVEPGRGSAAGDPTRECRRLLAQVFGVADSARVILTPSATLALNLAIIGSLADVTPGVIVTSTLEHNSVLRPIETLRERGWRVRLLHPGPDGRLSPYELSENWDADTRLVALTHCSNVTGVIQPVADFAAVAARHRVPLVLDLSQSAGAVPITVDDLPGRVFAAFAGHKGLYGPTGIGGLVVPDMQAAPLWVGGTGVHSESLSQPLELPMRYEAGTPNLPGIAGLEAGCRFVLDRGVVEMGAQRASLVRAARDLLGEIPGLTLTPLAKKDGRAGIVSFSLEGWKSEELAYTLAEVFDIEIRAGLHCAPLIHAEAGMNAEGCARVSFGAFNTEQDISALAAGLLSLGEATCGLSMCAL